MKQQGRAGGSSGVAAHPDSGDTGKERVAEALGDLSWFSCALGLLLLALLSDRLHGAEPDLARLAIVGLFTAYAVTDASWRQGTSKERWAGLALSLACSLVAVRTPAPASLAVAAVYWWALQRPSRRPEATSSSTRALLLTAGLYGLAIFLLEHLAPLANAWRGLAEGYAVALTALLGAAVPDVLRLGPTPLGMGLVLLFAIFACVAAQMGSERRLRTLLGFLALSLLAHTLYLALGERLGQALGRAWHLPTHSLLDLGPLLFALLLLPAALLIRSLRIRARARRALAFSPRAALLLLPALVLAAPLVPARRTCKVLVLDKGTLDWRVPTYESFGDRSGGMFGALPVYLESLGHEVVRGDTANEELDGYDLLVVANLYDALDSEELARIEGWLRAGGGLILVADHTGGEHIQDPSNQLLRATGISINFDTAVPRDREWLGCMRFASHPVTRSFDTQRDIWTWLGASLSLSGMAQPLLVGHLAYSDRGTVHNQDPARGYLGDMHYRHGERLGDVVIAASGRVGKGRVVVLGDTSPFQNGALVKSYHFVDRALRWASWRSWAADLWDYRYAIAGLLTLLAAALAWPEPWRRLAPTLGLLPAVSLLHLPMDHLVDSAPPVADNVAWIDTSHGNFFDSTAWEEDSVGGLEFNLYRAGHLPLLLRDFGRITSGPPGLLVLMRPTRACSRSELGALQAFVERGGRVLLAAGWENRAAVGPLLERFGLALQPTPLGQASGESSLGRPRFWHACPTGASLGAATPEVLCTASGYPVVVRRRLGTGQFVHVSDCCFLLNKNLEGSQDTLRMENVEFLRELLSDLRRER